jgi:hypothetical protein
MLQKLKAAGSWMWNHKLATAALVLPVIGVATAATVVAVQRRRPEDGITPEEHDLAERLERAHRGGEIR